MILISIVKVGEITRIWGYYSLLSIFLIYFILFFWYGSAGIIPFLFHMSILAEERRPKNACLKGVWKPMTGIIVFAMIMGARKWRGGQLCIFCPQNFLTPFDRIIFFIVLLSQLPCIEIKMEIIHSDINIPKECNRRGRTEVYEEVSNGQAQTVA